MIRRCKKCGYDLHIAAYPFVVSRGKRYRRKVCHLCIAEYHSTWQEKRGKTRAEKALYMRRWRLQRAVDRRRNQADISA